MDLALLLLSTAGLIIAPIAHEFTHAFVAYPVAEHVEIDYSSLTCRYTVPAGTSLRYVRLIGAAPTLIGIPLSALLVLTGVVPVQLESVPALVGMLIFSFGGELEDFRLTRSSSAS